MGTLTNVLDGPVTVHGVGGEVYDMAPGQTVEVDSKTDWPGYPYVKAGAVVYTPSAKSEARGRDKDEPQGKGKKGA